MTWDPPQIRSTGDLISAAIWNDEVVGNLSHLLNRPALALLEPIAANGPTTSVQAMGRWNAVRWDANSSDPLDCAAFHFYLPPDFASIDSLMVYTFASDTTTITYDLVSAFGTPGVDAYTHGGVSLFALTTAFTANILTAIDATSTLAGISAGEIGTLKLRAGGGTGTGNLYTLFAALTYTRS